MGESSKKKKMKKFDFVTEGGDHIHLTEEQIKEQKRIEESVKADLAKQEMLNRRVQSRITNSNVLTRKGPITLKVYREDGTDEVILNFKASDLHLSEWREIKQSERGILINQEKYVKDLLKKYDINGSSVKTPKANSKESHLIAVKRIFRYLKGTPSFGMWYPKCLGFDLKGYSNSDYAGCNMDRKSTSGASQLLRGKLVCWSAKKQQYVAMSLAEAKYVAAAVLHSRTKHIDIKYHFIKDHILKGDIELHFILTQYQLADIFTKPLDEPIFKRLIVELGMLNIDSKPEASILTEEN
ncbi:hypothetical protein Tco_1388436 [Tanacetum coccineum]